MIGSSERKKSWDSDANNDNRPELRDGAAPENRMPSNAPEDLTIQDPGASVPTPTAAKECFEKENDVLTSK